MEANVLASAQRRAPPESWCKKKHLDSSSSSSSSSSLTSYLLSHLKTTILLEPSTSITILYIWLNLLQPLCHCYLKDYQLVITEEVKKNNNKKKNIQPGMLGFPKHKDYNQNHWFSSSTHLTYSINDMTFIPWYPGKCSKYKKIYRYFFKPATNSSLCRPGITKILPGGQIQPVSLWNPAHKPKYIVKLYYH